MELATSTTGAITDKSTSQYYSIETFFGSRTVFLQSAHSIALAASLLKQFLTKDRVAAVVLLNRKTLHAINTIKTVLSSSLVVALPYSGCHLTIDDDACNIQRCCALLWKPPDATTKHIRCWSSSLLGTRRRYEKTQQERLTQSIFLLSSCLKLYRLAVGIENDASK